jgi:hypothetical protein
LPGPFQLRLGDAPGADPTRQARLDHGPDDVWGKERERDAVHHVPGCAALASRDLIDRYLPENIIEPSPPERDRAQQDGSGLGLDALPAVGVY